MSNKKETRPELNAEQVQELRQRRRKARRKRAGVVIDRIFGFLMATVIVVGLACLGLEYVLVKGPSPALRDTFVMTMLETRRFGFIPRIFLTQQEVEEIRALKSVHQNVDFDPTLIQIASENEGEENPAQPVDGQSTGSPYGLVDEDGDGLILEEVHGRGFSGYMLIVLDPSRVFIANGGGGLTIETMAQNNGAIAGINAGAFYDPNGQGSGGKPEGLTIYDGVVASYGYGCDPIAGFDENHILHVGYHTLEQAVNSGIVSCVSFGPPLIINGNPADPAELVSGVNPRTAIGQRADGAILMLVIDGRQGASMGANYTDCMEMMLQYGAVNASNMDGGSSTVMYLNGQVINSPSSATGGSRWLPNAFLVR